MLLMDNGKEFIKYISGAKERVQCKARIVYSTLLLQEGPSGRDRVGNVSEGSKVVCS
jgi:hypothetical protein